MLSGKRSQTRLACDTKRSPPDKKAERRFQPKSVRDEIDRRDGFTGNKREQKYKLFCKLAAHPTFVGFSMLRPDRKNAHLGPFFEEEALRAVLTELAVIAIQAGTKFCMFFPSDTEKQIEMKLSRRELFGMWCERFYATRYDPTEVNEIRAILAELKNGQGSVP